VAAGSACRCGCGDPRGARIHRIVDALALDDMDGAIDAGLLATDACPGCAPACASALAAARDGRRGALAARDRFRARQARLLRRRQERLARRAPVDDAMSSPRASLPPAAAAALQRALAKASGRGRT
jgi:hypothetical protein